MKISQYAWRILADVKDDYLRLFLTVTLAGATPGFLWGYLYKTPIFFSWRR